VARALCEKGSRVSAPNHLRGYSIVLAGTVIWALTGIVIKILLTTYALEPLTIAFWRVFIVTAFLFCVLLVFNSRALRIDPRDILIFLVYGLIGVAIHQLVWISSVQYNGAAVATVIIYTAPAIVAILATRFLREQMTREKLLALILTIAGCALVARAYDFAQFQLNVVGIAAGIGSAFTFATYSLIGRVVTRRYSAWTALFYAFLAGAIFLSPVAFIVREFAPARIGGDGWLTLAFLALVPTLGGFGAFTIGLSHLPASVASILAAFEPVTTALIAYFMFAEILEPFQLLGAGCILCGVVLLRPK
jgi:drug/metabolite transporter (DMT)-like permease